VLDQHARFRLQPPASACLHPCPIQALHPLVSSLYTQFTALALELDERLDTLEQRVLHEADDPELAEITAIRRRAAVTRRILTPGRDLAARTLLCTEDINDQLQQVVVGFTAIEERCAALLVLHASLASKHTAVVSRRLADVATIFLPISFLPVAGPPAVRRCCYGRAGGQRW